uniref:Uncharacterized protein n=1 Tax=Tetranychus urticae TaxID=32264 RepID=T1KG38_TETUR
MKAKEDFQPAIESRQCGYWDRDLLMLIRSFVYKLFFEMFLQLELSC